MILDGKLMIMDHGFPIQLQLRARGLLASHCNLLIFKCKSDPTSSHRVSARARFSGQRYECLLRTIMPSGFVISAQVMLTAPESPTGTRSLGRVID